MQMKDIDLTAYLTSGGAGYAAWGTNGWLPIGSFLGSYDGNNYKISGLKISRYGNSPIGLFGETGDGSTIKNLGVTTVSIDLGVNVGGLVGSNHAVINNCYVTGTINGSASDGGLVGINNDSISNCYSIVTVNGFSHVGGIAGINNSVITNCYVTGSVHSDMGTSGGFVAFNYGTITYCYATGSIIGDLDVGGFVGNNQGPVSNCYSSMTVYGNVNSGGFAGINSSTISKCYSTGNLSSFMQSGYGGLVGRNSGSIVCSYATGSVSGVTDTGGLVGINSGSITNCYSTGTLYGEINSGGLVGTNYGTITYCYANGVITLTPFIQNPGGLVGVNGAGGVVTGSYWDKESTGLTTSSGSDVAYGKTTAEMKTQVTFSNWDFVITPVWKIEAAINNSYPSFVWHNLPETPTAEAPGNISINSFTANWSASEGATKYHLDVATDNAFTNFVSGYDDRNLGNVLSYNVTGLSIGTNYYYRVRGYNVFGSSENSSSMLVTTSKISQVITFTLSGVTYGVAPFTISAVGGASGNPVTFTSSDNSIATCTGTNGETITVLKAGTVKIFADQEGNGSYYAAPRVSQDLTINPKTVTITGVSANNKVYDGTTTAALVNGSLNGVVSPDVVTIIAGTGNFEDKNVGLGKTVVVKGYELTGINATNYSLQSQPSGITADITVRHLEITADDGQNKQVGEPDPVFTYTITSGNLLVDDVLTGTLSRTAGETAGNYPIVIGSLEAGSNYDISFISSNFVIKVLTGIKSPDVDEVGIYPNPTNGILNINTTEGQIVVLNAEGRILIKKLLRGDNIIDLSNQPKGVYILLLTTKSSAYHYKIIRE